jgi:hypothetical protein
MAAHGRFSTAWQAAWGSWLSIASICVVIWLATGASLAMPWFLWVVGPWGLLMFGRWITGAPGHHGHSPGGSNPPGSNPPGSNPRSGDRHHSRDRHRDRDRHRGRDRHRDL